MMRLEWLARAGILVDWMRRSGGRGRREIIVPRALVQMLLRGVIPIGGCTGGQWWRHKVLVRRMRLRHGMRTGIVRIGRRRRWGRQWSLMRGGPLGVVLLMLEGCAMMIGGRGVDVMFGCGSIGVMVIRGMGWATGRMLRGIARGGGRA